MKWLLAALMVLPAECFGAIAVMEGIAASNQTIFVDTQTGRVDIATASYGGIVPTVSLYTASNVVVGNVVIYATGSLVANGLIVPSTTTYVRVGDPVYGTSRSTCTDDLSAMSIIPVGVDYSVAMASLTYVVTSSTFDICFFGSFYVVGSGGLVGWSFLVDDQYHSPYTGSKGIIYEDGIGSSPAYAVASACHRVHPGDVSAGSHVFAFTPSGNIGNTVYGGGAKSTGYFCITEVH